MNYTPKVFRLDKVLKASREEGNNILKVSCYVSDYLRSISKGDHIVLEATGEWFTVTEIVIENTKIIFDLVPLPERDTTGFALRIELVSVDTRGEDIDLVRLVTPYPVPTHVNVGNWDSLVLEFEVDKGNGIKYVKSNFGIPNPTIVS